ncbi:MAG: glycosyltransferase family 2 protein [Eubacteriales bacterium]
MTADIIIIVLGLLFSALLFFRYPELGNPGKKNGLFKLSVIIPVRNEEKNLPLILNDLLKQTEFIYEIICVDEGSVDKTAKVARSFGVTLITPPEKPDCWTGKSWACHNGAKEASGEIFVFIDADVRLSPDGINRLIRTYEDNGCVLSVQPYHKMYKRYEQLSVFFNLIQTAANGLTFFIKNKHIGLYGPVILIGRTDYYKIGGHASVRDSIPTIYHLADN